MRYLGETREWLNRTRQLYFTVTGGERTGGVLLAHVKTSKELHSQVSVDHVVHLDQGINTCRARKTKLRTYVVSVGRHGWRAAQLTVEEDAVLAEDVPGDPHLPPVTGLHHHVVVTPGLLQSAAVLVPPVALLSISGQQIRSYDT